MVFLDFGILRINVSAKFALYFSVFHPYSVGKAIALDEFSQCVAVLNPGDDGDFVADRCD